MIEIPPVIVLRDCDGILRVSSELVVDEKYDRIIRKIEEANQDSNKTLFDIQTIFFNEVTPIQNAYCIAIHLSYWSQCWEPMATKPEQYTNEMYMDALRKRCEWKGSLELAKKSLKDSYASQCINFIRYQMVCEMYQRLSNDSSVKLYSNETMGNFKGDGTQKWSVSDDLEVCIKTNFCYGTRSYFYLNISYKGVVIPYFSLLTKFYSINNSFCDRTLYFKLTRDAWTPALEFVRNIVTQYRNEPDEFVENYIKEEIEEMMSGLKFIVSNSKDSLRLFVEEYNLNKDESDTTKWSSDYKALCVSPISKSDIDIFEKSPSETSLIFKAEKMKQVAGTLGFFKRIADTWPKAVDYAKEICDMIAAVTSEVQEMLDELSDKIPVLEAQWKCKDDERIMLCEQEENYENELNELLGNLPSDSNGVDEDKVREKFEEEHPDYVSLKEKHPEVLHQECVLRNELGRWKNFEKRLSSCLFMFSHYMTEYTA